MLLKLLIGFVVLQIFLKQWGRARLADFVFASKMRGEDMDLLIHQLRQGPAECYVVCNRAGDRLTPWLLAISIFLQTPARLVMVGCIFHLLLSL